MALEKHLVAAARRIATADEGAALELAVAYQLMSKHTNCILVHQRAEADKATEEAELHRVSSMLAAGWGATATVMESASMDYCALSTPSVWRSARSAAPAAVASIRFSCALPDDFEIPAFLRKQADESQPASLQAMVAAVFEHLSYGGTVQGLASHCDALELHTDARLALDQAVALGLSIGDAWLSKEDVDRARQHYERSLEIDFDAFALIGMSHIARLKKNFADAEACCNRVLREKPGFERALEELSLVLIDKDRAAKG